MTVSTDKSTGTDTGAEALKAAAASDLSPREVTPATDKTAAAPDKAPAQVEDKSKKRFFSLGHRIHNEFTYRVIDWLMNSTVGVATTFWAARTSHGEKYFQKPVSRFFEKILSPVLKDAASLKEGAKWGTSFTSIMAGGFTIIPMLMLMENRKVKKNIIHWLDDRVYGKEKVDHDPRFKEAYDRLDNEPPKGFKAGMLARFAAILPLIIAASIPATNKQLMKYIYNPIGKRTKWLAEKMQVHPNEWWANPKYGKSEHIDGDPKSPKVMQSNWDFLHQTIGFDFGLTIFYAILHEAAYKALAARHAKHRRADDVPAAASQPKASEPSTVNSIAADDTSTPGKSWADKSGGPRTRETPVPAADHLSRVESRASDPAAQPAI